MAAVQKLKISTETGDYSLPAAFDALPDPVLVLDETGMVLEVNHAAQSLFGAGRGALIGQTLDGLFAQGSVVLSLFERSVATGSSLSDTGVDVRLKSGARRRRTGLHVTPFAHEGAGRWLMVLREQLIADEIRSQRDRRHRLDSYETMAAMLSHEIKNPLSGIAGAAQLLEDGADADGRELLELIREEARRIGRLADRIELLSGARPKTVAPVNIHEVLDHVHRVAAAGFAKNIEITANYDPSLPPVPGERDLLLQAMLNLVKNAAEAAPEEGGRITLKTFYNGGRGFSGGDMARLPVGVAVEDNGAGVSEEIAERLFDPFFSTKHDGTGLGLSLTARIVDDHNGAIRLEGGPGETRFVVSLPCWRDDK